MAFEHPENPTNFSYRFITIRQASHLLSSFSGPFSPCLIITATDDGKSDSSPNSLQRQPELLPTCFQKNLVFFQTSHFEETTPTYPYN